MTDQPPWTPGPWIATRTLIGSTQGDMNRREVLGYERHSLNLGSASPPGDTPARHGVFQDRMVCRLNSFMREWTPEDEANLRLILGAPEMVVALATAESALRKLRQSAIKRDGNQAWDDGEIATEALDVVIAALAKVRAPEKDVSP